MNLARRLWLLFAQAVTVALAVAWVLVSFHPAWLAPVRHLVRSDASLPPDAPRPAGLPSFIDDGQGPISYAEAARRALPAVVNVYRTRLPKGTRGAGGSASDWVTGPPAGGGVPDSRNPADAPALPGAIDPDQPSVSPFDDPGDDDESRAASLGSGVLASADGYVLTNNHVVEGDGQIAVALADGRRVAARRVGSDPDTDLAVLKIDLVGLPTIEFGHAENLRVGDVVLAIGNPFDVGQTVTMGIVSALGRADLGLSTYENFIQTDAAINQGNSGGALIDTQGRLVGINTAIFTRGGGSIGIGFAIPTTTVNAVMSQLIKNGFVRRGYLGVEPLDVNAEIARVQHLPRDHGVMVHEVGPNSPASRGGVEPGDLLLAINGTAVTNARGMLNQIQALEPGSSAQVRVLRANREQVFNVTVGQRPVAKP